MDCTARCSLLGKYGSGGGTGDARSQRQSENKIGETLVLKNNVINFIKLATFTNFYMPIRYVILHV